jgi:positive regulator of sigma E activity
MLYQTGTVVEIRNSSVRIEFEQGSACGGCAAGQGCGLGPLLTMFRRRPHAFWLDLETVGRAGLETGDRLRVALTPGQLTRFAGLAYAMPTAGLLVGAWIFGSLFPGLGELSAVAGGVAGISAAWLGLTAAGKRLPAISIA